jgi:type II secretory pathway pseudopilin PulG
MRVKMKKAFSMLELVFVIVIMGIIGKFGTEFLAESYKGFIFSNVNNTLQSRGATAVEFISSRLQHRIKDSIIARDPDNFSDFASLSNAADQHKMIEWVQTDIENFRSISKPDWSGIIDVDHHDSNINTLISPETNTSAIDEMIDILSYEDSSIADAAIYFIGSNNDINGYGWDGSAITEQTNGVMHPIKATSNENEFAPSVDDFSGVDIYEYYKLAWSANAIVLENYNSDTNMGDLMFYYDYQPWNGQTYKDDGKKSIIMQNVSTFRAMAMGSVIKIQVCTKSDLVEEYSLCKEKTIF